MAVSWRDLRQGQGNVYVIIAYALLLQAFMGPSIGPLLSAIVSHAQQQYHNQHTTPNIKAAAPVDYFRPMADLVEPHGYQLEEHFVTTQDGFILRMFRIPGHCSSSRIRNSSRSRSTHNSARNSTHNSSNMRPVAFLQHALMDSSGGWLLLGPQRSLALQLADAGFDVWLGNSRGNRYSRNHTSLQPEDAAFWGWSWDHMAEMDLPASINYALAVSGQQQLVFVGYSQGTMIALAALSSQQQLAASVSLAVLMAPVSFTTSMASPAFLWSARLGLDRFALTQGWGEWGSFQQATSEAMMPVCKRWPRVCLTYLTGFCGKNPKASPHGNIEPELVPRVFRHLPAGTSVQVMAHWGQSIRRGSTTHLHRFDFGTNCDTGSSNSSSSSQQQIRPRCNQAAYGQATPPEYDLAAITTPLVLFTGGRDTISSVADVGLLKQRLRPGVLQLHHHQPDYAHLDYELGSDAPDKAYPDVLRLAIQFGFSKH